MVLPIQNLKEKDGNLKTMDFNPPHLCLKGF